MKFKIDENLPSELVEDFRTAGHEADTVVDQGLVGAADNLIMARAQAESRVLMTLDKGIGDVRIYPPDKFSGIVLFRPPSTGRMTTLSFVRQNLPKLLALDLAGHLFVVSPGSIRRR